MITSAMFSFAIVAVIAEISAEASKYSAGEIAFILASFFGGLGTLIAAIASGVVSILNSGKLAKLDAKADTIADRVNGHHTAATSKADKLQVEVDILRAALSEKKQDAATLARTAENHAVVASEATLTAASRVEDLRKEVAELKAALAIKTAAIESTSAPVAVVVKNDTDHPVPTKNQNKKTP